MDTLTPASTCRQVTLRLLTPSCTAFVDLTDRIEALVTDAHLQAGFVNVQTRHTTAAIVVNEHEPLLLADFEDFLCGLAPSAVRYRHDDRVLGLAGGARSNRSGSSGPEDPDSSIVDSSERRNGHAHCRALLLPTSACLNVADGRLQLGCWQRVFLVELDGPRQREVSVLCLGETRR